MTDVNNDHVDKVESRRRKLYAVAREHGLSREDRLDLAEKFLWCDVESWKDLNDAQISRLLDGFEVHELLSHLKDTAPPRQQPEASDPGSTGS